MATNPTNFNFTISSTNIVDQTVIPSPVTTVSDDPIWIPSNDGVDVEIDNNGLTMAMIRTDGTLWMWGCGVSGALGNNNTNDRSSPVQTVATGTNWKQVATNFFATVAVKTDGTLWTWGNNVYGQSGICRHISYKTNNERWKDSFDLALEMFDEARVIVNLLEEQ